MSVSGRGLTSLQRWWFSCWGWWCAAACSSWGCTAPEYTRLDRRWFLKYFFFEKFEEKSVVWGVWCGFQTFGHLLFRPGVVRERWHLTKTNIWTSNALDSTFFWLKVNTDSFRVWFLHRSQISDLLHNKLDRAHSVGFLWILLHYAAKSITTFQASWRWER